METRRDAARVEGPEGEVAHYKHQELGPLVLVPRRSSQDEVRSNDGHAKNLNSLFVPWVLAHRQSAIAAFRITCRTCCVPTRNNVIYATRWRPLNQVNLQFVFVQWM